jgi:hypothetical protein
VAQALRSAIVPARKGDTRVITGIRADLDVSGPRFARVLTLEH